MHAGRDITVIIPALNEALSVARVIEELRELQVCTHCNQLIGNLENSGTPATASDHCSCEPKDGDIIHQTVALVDRIIVCDNGSTDDTASIAAASGAIVTYEPARGYGAACLAALAVEADKDIVAFVDADHSVVASELPTLIQPLHNGADLVIGSRTLGQTEKGALSVPQQFGNALASWLIRKLWSADVTDLGPFRATTQATLNDLQMTDRQFGWTVEMQVRALQLGKRVDEVPVNTLKRIGKSKISGTVRGVIGAGNGILGTIFKLYLTGSRKNAAPELNPGETN